MCHYEKISMMHFFQIMTWWKTYWNILYIKIHHSYLKIYTYSKMRWLIQLFILDQHEIKNLRKKTNFITNNTFRSNINVHQFMKKKMIPYLFNEPAFRTVQPVTVAQNVFHYYSNFENTKLYIIYTKKKR